MFSIETYFFFGNSLLFLIFVIKLDAVFLYQNISYEVKMHVANDKIKFLRILSLNKKKSIKSNNNSPDTLLSQEC